MKIISRYVLKEHFGPFLFALSALTSLLLLQYIARQFGNLVGKGLSWQVIAEFFVLSIPFTIEMTIPMSVLVAVLYAFSRLAAENEITALKAGGVSTRSLLKPVLVAAVFLTLFMVYFNDQIESRANHELATLQTAILRTKPTFALKPQVINTVKETQLYLKADQIDRDESGRMTGVTIFDVTDASKRRSIYADSGVLTFASNKKDLVVHLYHGVMMSIPTDKPEQLSRIYYRENIQKVRDVASALEPMSADTTAKGEREMTVCEMQKEFEKRDRQLQRALLDSQLTQWRIATQRGKNLPRPAEPQQLETPVGIGGLYCLFVTKYLHIPAAQAAELPARLRQQPQAAQQPAQQPVQQDTSKKPKDDSVFVLVGTQLKKVARNNVPAGAFIPETAAAHPTNQPAPATAGQNPPVPIQAPAATTVPAVVPAVVPAQTPNPSATPIQPPQAVGRPNPTDAASGVELADSRIRLEDARHWRNRYAVEIQKKFSLAAACIVFVLVGAPIALRFPRAGVGLVMGVGFLVFAIYYVGLIGGESLSDKALVSPFIAMWIDNIVFLLLGLILVAFMGNENTTSRGSPFAEKIEAIRERFRRREATS